MASPFKPIDYMDKMDLFGYSYLPQFKPTKSHFLAGEVKKDAAKLEHVDQLMKYVDWVKDEYCFGDYSMINAFLVAYDFDKDVLLVITSDHGELLGEKESKGMNFMHSFGSSDTILVEVPLLRVIDVKKRNMRKRNNEKIHHIHIFSYTGSGFGIPSGGARQFQ